MGDHRSPKRIVPGELESAGQRGPGGGGGGGGESSADHGGLKPRRT